MAYRARGRRSLASRVAGGLNVPRHSFTATPLPVTATVSITNNSNLTTTSSAQIEPRRSSGSISLEDLFQQIRANTDMVKRIDGHVKILEEKTSQLATAVKELNDFLKKQNKDLFVIKGSKYEAQLKSEAATLFCLSLRRKPTNADIQAMLKRVLRTQEGRVDKHKFEVALTYVKSKLTDYRTEERRKVIGLNPYERMSYLDTTTLHEQLVKSMRPTEESEEVYMKHLAILRKFVRENAAVPTNFYSKFREWLDINFPTIIEGTFHEIMDEDSSVDYNTLGSGMQVLEEETIQTSSGYYGDTSPAEEN